MQTQHGQSLQDANDTKCCLTFSITINTKKRTTHHQQQQRQQTKKYEQTIIMAVKRKDALLNKLLTRRNQVACHYHSLYLAAPFCLRFG